MADEKRATPYDEMSWADSPLVYRPLNQKASQNDISLLFRVRTDQKIIPKTIHEAVAHVDADVVVGDMQTAQDLVGRYTAYPRFRAVILGGFAGLALLSLSSVSTGSSLNSSHSGLRRSASAWPLGRERKMSHADC